MNFQALEAAASAFTARINEDLGREAIKPVTMETPFPPPDELYFNRLVAWCYGFFFEAASDMVKECRGLLKQNSPERTNRHTKGIRVINSLRTYKFHNLPPGRDNDRKKAEAKAWLADYEKSSEGVAKSCEMLCAEALALIDDLMQLWRDATSDADDAVQLFNQVNQSLDQLWPPHELDAILREVALEIKLEGFDAKAFRDDNLEGWRKLAGCFTDRASAEIGMRRAIRTKMHQAFGAGA